MIKLIVVAHGQLASGILTSLKLIAGQIKDIEAVDFLEKMSTHDLENALKSAMSDNSDVLILADLLGGTPFKTAVELTRNCSGKKVAVVSGLNLAMLLEANFSRLTDDFEDLISKLVTTGQLGIVDSISLLSEREQDDDLFEDGI